MTSVVDGMPAATRPATGIAVPLSLVSLLAAILLVYSSGSFLFAEVLGVKRFLQVFLVCTLLAGTAYAGLRLKLRSVDPLLGFVFAMLIVELALRRQPLFVLDALASLLALIAIAMAPRDIFWTAARASVWLVTLFACMALLQWVMLLRSPELADFRLSVNEAGAIENSVKHPAMYLGLFKEPVFNLFGRPLARMQSFAMEPSLNVVYFMLPACLAIFLDRRLYFGLALVILGFCVLSFSGSVLLSCAFSALWLLLLTVIPLRFAFSYGLFVLLFGYFLAIKRIGYDAILAGIAVLAQYGDFLGKTASVTVRGFAATENLGVAITQPFGSTNVSDMAGPWPINAALAAGWAGPILIFFFLRSLGRRVERLNEGQPLLSRTRFGTIVLLGAMSTIVSFNDYQMTAYGGIVLLAFLSRAISLRVESEDEARARR